ncbi:MAG: hypothetical protein O2923_12110 [Verrucomicrobia bacterium]|nr:hypothetical protein [Verrucomicrobiota bacterium]MDA1088183.1 hypothetical protein [Verrucomicrobiota bacterium]
MIKHGDLQILCRGVCTALVIATFALPARAEVDVLDWLAQDPKSEGARRAIKESIKASSNRTERAKLAVAYCLACRYVGDWEEASRAQVFVNRDHNGNPYLRYLDPSRTEDVCTHCLGEKMADYTCKTCTGRSVCASCKGTGEKALGGFDRNGPGPCGVCQGSGECRACDGTGTTRSGCRTCLGKGTHHSKTRTYTSLQALVHDVEAPVASATAPGSNPIVAALAHLDALPDAYRSADTTLKKESVFKTYVDSLPQKFKRQTLTLTSTIKDVKTSNGGQVYVATTGFREIGELKSAESGIGLHKGRALHILMSNDEAAGLSPGQEIAVTGRLEYRRGYRSDVAVNYARDFPVLHMRLIDGSGRKDIGQIYMTDYTCKIGDKRYRSPFK